MSFLTDFEMQVSVHTRKSLYYASFILLNRVCKT